jgi:hypothetical protein
MAAKVTGSNFYDKLREYVHDAEVADEFAAKILQLFESVLQFHEAKDSADETGSVTADVGGDSK